MPECRVSGQSDDDEDYYDDKLCDLRSWTMFLFRNMGALRLSDDDEDYYDDKLCDLRSRGLCSCSETWVHFDYRELR
ncbi:hypothetical protein CEXT_277661 [Caerostris extrusa]|uniref:Uncharacterized protein n=1 Tax=Caerostris extrusa TaxID=172846 RepID=A0AAV4P0B3_CAEEX|nr:hypothetical protein CEXT_277661 [Caerostris extrusa]